MAQALLSRGAMVHTRVVRAAILTSLGLLPLGCFQDEAIAINDGVNQRVDPDGTARTSPVDPPPDTDVAQDPLILFVPDDRHDSGPDVVPRPLQGCGQSTAVFAEDAPRYVGGNTPVLTQGIATGIYACESGLLHRPEPVTCQSGLPRSLPSAANGGDASAPLADAGAAGSQVALLYPGVSAFAGQCTADADCTAQPHGYCAPAYYGGPAAFDIQCNYGCLSDADCGPDYLCECGDPVGHCVKAQCQSDQDCAGDLKCAAWFTPHVCSRGQFYSCQTPDDECNTSADCAAGYCSGADGLRSCDSSPQAVCGRPFLIQGEPKLADLKADLDWCPTQREPAASLAHLSQPAREHIGEQWARIGLMEHASIAAFARFTLQLMHLGAPRELVERSQQAMWDETAHAKACFGLAARYLGAPVGPGRLSMDSALEDIELGHIVLTAFREGCVGETLATLEAREGCDAATDPEVRRTLAQIAVDELRHSELAWQFVRWALERGGESLQRSLTAEVARLEDEASRARSTDDSPGAPEHGLLSAFAKARVRHAALSDVVLPCARQLLARAARARGRDGGAFASAQLSVPHASDCA